MRQNAWFYLKSVERYHVIDKTQEDEEKKRKI